MNNHETFADFELSGWGDENVCVEYDKHFGSVTIQSVPALLDAARVTSERRVLDVCCGAGYAAGLASKRGAEAIGIDFSQAQVELARARYPRARFEQGDATALAFDDRSFDCVVNGIGMPHFEDPDAAIAEAHRVLRDGGRFAFTVYAEPGETNGFGLIYGAVQTHGTMDVGLPAGPSFFLFSDRRESERRLAAAGFVDMEFRTVPQAWHLESAEALFQGVMQGSVRAAATLRGQGADALAKIRHTVGVALESYRVADGYELPMPAVVVSAARP